jgi:hypothetical protein
MVSETLKQKGVNIDTVSKSKFNINKSVREIMLGMFILIHIWKIPI